MFWAFMAQALPDEKGHVSLTLSLQCGAGDELFLRWQKAVKPSIDVIAMSKGNDDDYIPIYRVDAPPRRYPQCPDVLVTPELVNINICTPRLRMRSQWLEGHVEQPLCLGR